ncbi:GNAT family N-acetyltransferase [Psychroserpens sp. Hel_I_66]|uniref:GNAT family N-acetyltransferase n=1 Tax=Psychroserpens sp. Hel_I_66 TaxID=1250004 RepID=UPI000A85FF64|nr:GNAT family N-acetyltransferase [Psychroserpens sp. Hel_I_66]
MDYHQDRFEDFSLMVYKGEKLVALLPANRLGNTVFSHKGLSYGGLILDSNLKFKNVLKVLKSILNFLYLNSVKTVEFKILPTIYNVQPSDELSYLMFLTNANLIRRDALSVLNLKSQPKRSKDRINGYKRGVKNNLIVKEVKSFDEFWNDILIKNLQKKHQTHPVHSLEEIIKLKKMFPNNIRQFNVYYQNKIVAGTTIFETPHVAHSQYISGNTEKNSLGSLDFLHIHLIDTIFKDKNYFDFGISNENNGKQVNSGLQYWKEGFGARTITQDFYSLKTENYKLLDDVMI